MAAFSLNNFVSHCTHFTRALKSKYIKNDKKRNVDVSAGCSKSNGASITVFTYQVVKRFVSTARRSGQYEKNITGLAR